MPNPSRPARSLPPLPNLEQQKKQARELLEAARAHDPAALRRFRTHHPRLAAQPEAEWPMLALHDAQLVLAREYGFASWTKLKAHIDETVAARRTRPLVGEIRYYEDRARGLLEVLADGASATLDQVRSWHPRFAEASDDSIRVTAAAGDFTIDDARLVYAREHGFADWSRFAEHVDKLARGAATEPFIEVVEAGKRGDWQRVNALLRAHPELIRARGTNGNTLLNLASSLVACRAPDDASGDDDPASGTDRLAPVRLLLAAGADPNKANDRGWTPLHQAGYRNDPGMAKLLLNAGASADLEAHGEGGTPLAVALFWGNREAAEVVASAGIVPANLRVAADSDESTCSIDASRVTEASRSTRALRVHSTGRTAAFRRGLRRTIHRRFSTRRSCGLRSRIAPKRWRSWSKKVRVSMRIPTAGRLFSGLPRLVASTRPGGCSTAGPT
jgi:hypothetical protein